MNKSLCGPSTFWCLTNCPVIVDRFIIPGLGYQLFALYPSFLTFKWNLQQRSFCLSALGVSEWIWSSTEHLCTITSPLLQCSGRKRAAAKHSQEHCSRFLFQHLRNCISIITRKLNTRFKHRCQVHTSRKKLNWTLVLLAAFVVE